MKKKSVFVIIIIFFIFFCHSSFAGTQDQDFVYLKNGNVIKGEIIKLDSTIATPFPRPAAHAKHGDSACHHQQNLTDNLKLAVSTCVLPQTELEFSLKHVSKVSAL